MHRETDLISIGRPAVRVLVDLCEASVAGAEDLVLVGLVRNTEQREGTANPGFIAEELRDDGWTRSPIAHPSPPGTVEMSSWILDPHGSGPGFG